MQNISVVSYEAKYKSAYVSLNKAWIEKYFRMEPADEHVLQDVEANVINTGGAVLIALDDCTAAGVVGLRKIDNDVYEMIKMAVSEQYQGRGIGHILGVAIIEEAARLGARKVILYSNRSLKPALSLYHKLGFVEIPMEPDNDYLRSDIKMELLLDKRDSSYRNSNENRQEPNAVF